VVDRNDNVHDHDDDCNSQEQIMGASNNDQQENAFFWQTQEPMPPPPRRVPQKEGKGPAEFAVSSLTNHDEASQHDEASSTRACDALQSSSAPRESPLHHEDPNTQKPTEATEETGVSISTQAVVKPAGRSIPQTCESPNVETLDHTKEDTSNRPLTTERHTATTTPATELTTPAVQPTDNMPLETHHAILQQPQEHADSATNQDFSGNVEAKVETTSTSNPRTTIHLRSDQNGGTRHATDTASVDPSSPRQQSPILYFVRRGGLSQKRIELLSKRAKSKGAAVLDHLSSPLHSSTAATTPTHLVMEPSTSVSALLAELQLADQDSLREWLYEVRYSQKHVWHATKMGVSRMLE
jgi:hypothetical protein